jgi:hypothetical protein
MLKICEDSFIPCVIVQLANPGLDMQFLLNVKAALQGVDTTTLQGYSGIMIRNLRHLLRSGPLAGRSVHDPVIRLYPYPELALDNPHLGEISLAGMSRNMYHHAVHIDDFHRR